MIKTLEFETIDKNGAVNYEWDIKVNIFQDKIRKTKKTDILGFYVFKDLCNDLKHEIDVETKVIELYNDLKVYNEETIKEYYPINTNNDILLRIVLK